MSGTADRAHRPGRLTRPELRTALAAPREVDGFTSRWHWVRAQRLHIRQRVATAVDTLPCVLLHGLAVSHRYLMPTARCLRRRSVYLPDMLGFGLSDKPASVLDVPRHAAVLAAWLDSADIPAAVLVGDSFGCQVAVELADRRPDRVAALVLVGPTTDPAAASLAAQLRRLAGTLFCEDWRQAPILRADLRDAGLRRVAASLRHAVRDRIDAKLPRTRVPTLLIRGTRDRIVPRPWLERAAALVPNAHTLAIEGAAHHAVTTAGPHVAAAIDAFVDRYVADRG